MSASPYKSSTSVDVWKLRQLFNEGRFVERGESGELRVEISRSKEVTENKVRNWVPGTLSQELKFFDPTTGLLVAKAHRYIRPDGLLAASGMVDPKRIAIDGVLYHIQTPIED